MAAIIHTKPAARKPADKTITPAKVPDTAEAKAKVDAADALLDEIDAILADVVGDVTEQQFVSQYVQKGGE